MLRNSFVELRARERAFQLLDKHEGKEVLDPFYRVKSPHLEPQGIVPSFDDGVVLVRGKMQDKDVLIVSIEGKFQGGGIGEVAGAKIAMALEMALEENKEGHPVYPVIILDTGGVRLQEANYGLLSISEIGNMIVALKKYVPVIGLVPGLVGSFGGMSITSALMSYLIATNKARVGLNGPEVIEQEAGVREFDASDKALIWDTIGARQRVATGVIDELVKDDVEVIREAIITAIVNKKDSKRTEKANFFLDYLSQMDASEKLTSEKYIADYEANNEKEFKVKEAYEGNQRLNNTRGYKWFAGLTGMKQPTSDFPTVLSKTVEINKRPMTFVTITTNDNNRFYRVRNGEAGLVEGFVVSKVLEQVIGEDKDKKEKRPIIAIIDVPSQAYGYNEELIGIHMALASSAEFYARARQAGHPVVGLIVGNAISGAFLAHGLQCNRLIALNDEQINVQAMSKESAARVTNRTLEEVEEATKKIPAMAYDIKNFEKLGALFALVDGIEADRVSETDVEKMQDVMLKAIASTENAPTDLSFRYETEQAKSYGRVATRQVREMIREQW